MKCSECGKNLKDGSNICPNCGSSKDFSTEKKYDVFIIFLLVIIILILIFAIAFAYFALTTPTFGCY